MNVFDNVQDRLIYHQKEFNKWKLSLNATEIRKIERSWMKAKNDMEKRNLESQVLSQFLSSPHASTTD